MDELDGDLTKYYTNEELNKIIADNREFGEGLKKYSPQELKLRQDLNQPYKNAKTISKAHIKLFKNVPKEISELKFSPQISKLFKKYQIKTKNKTIGEVIDELIDIINFKK